MATDCSEYDLMDVSHWKIKCDGIAPSEGWYLEINNEDWTCLLPIMSMTINFSAGQINTMEIRLVPRSVDIDALFKLSAIGVEIDTCLLELHKNAIQAKQGQEGGTG
jgi:hypothetical protein